MDHTETRRFKMHPKLLFDVIKRQAGTLSKAVLEGVMNSVDAKATKCEVTIDEKKVTIVDNGRGMTERRTIEEFFEVFGQPHSEAEEKTFGTFRMGRGQLFAFGRNHWKTGPFEMRVDIQKDGIEYQLTDHARINGNGEVLSDGCIVEVELYEKLMPSLLIETLRTLQRWVKYCPIPVLINGEDCRVDPAKEKWDHVTDDAYIRLTQGGELSIYNLGIFVMGLSNHQMGTGGVVVTKKQVKVNFARNDVQHDCEVWRRLRPFLVHKAEERMVKERLQPHERANLSMRFLEDPTSRNPLWSEKLVVLSDGKTLTLKGLEPWGTWFENYARMITCAPSYSIVGDRLLQRKLALVVSYETLRNFGFTEDLVGLKKLLTMVRKASNYGPTYEERWTVVELDKMEKELKGRGEIIPMAELSEHCKTWVGFIERIYRFVPNGGKRAIRVGRKEGAAAWTDGTTYIAFEVGFLAGCPYTMFGLSKVLYTLMHEEAHEDGTITGHIHGVEFWERLEALNMNVLPALWQRTPERFLQTLRESDRRGCKGITSICDRIEKMTRAAEKLTATQARLSESKDRLAAALTKPQKEVPKPEPVVTKSTPAPKRSKTSKSSKGEQSFF